MILSDQVWDSNVLARNGIQYHIILYALPVLPIGVVSFVWYILLRPGQAPLPIIGIVMLVSLVLLHQEVEIIRFFRVASCTVKKVVFSGDDFIIYLFSNKAIVLSEFNISKDIPEALNNSIYRKLFPKDKENGIIRTSEGEYYLTGTINDFENLYQRLKEKQKQINNA